MKSMDDFAEEAISIWSREHLPIKISQQASTIREVFNQVLLKMKIKNLLMLSTHSP